MSSEVMRIQLNALLNQGPPLGVNSAVRLDPGSLVE